MEVLVTSIQNFNNRDQETIDMLVAGLKLCANDDMIIVLDKLQEHLDTLRPELTVVVETEYVDCVYRDCYYKYYSTKLKPYNRNCIRLSFFENYISSGDVIDAEYAHKLQDAYLGFMILRPLINACVGRSVISPKAKVNYKDLAIRGTMVKASCMGYKLNAYGFPHSSQDGEMMTCAETTIWAMMEYFGNKYSIYTTTLPTAILESSESLSYQRRIPSSGMYYEQISKVLKQYGLGCIVYDCENPRFKELFTCYVESGFPLAVCLFDKDETEGHAIVCVGRKEVSRDKIIAIPAIKIKIDENNEMELKSWNMAIDEFIFNDDNVPCYQIATFDAPVKHYEDKAWKDVKITQFIVPLHKKIYIDAETAIDVANSLLIEVIGVDSGCVVRTFLTSSRSYKDYVTKNKDFPQDEKLRLFTLDMAKFIWVTEYADVESFCNGKVNGIILMDATGHIDAEDTSSIILYQKGKSAFVYNQETNTHREYKELMSTCFDSFNNNLKTENYEKNGNIC